MRSRRLRLRASKRNTKVAAVARRAGVVTSPEETRSERKHREFIEALRASA